MLVESLSGVRGIAGEDLNEEIVRKYARAFAYRIKEAGHSSIAIGYDTRPSSPEISKWMTEEFLREGIEDIYDCKVASTGAMHLAVTVFNTGGAVMITASHNEPKWNGLKFMRADGALLHPQEATDLMHASREIQLSKEDVDVSGTMDVSRRLTQEYVLLLLRTIGEKARTKLAEQDLHLLVDTNGGAAIPYVKEFFDTLHITITWRGEVPGEFWRTVEPKPESLAPLVDMLDLQKEDFALAFDCDADRMEFVVPKNSAYAEGGTPFVTGQYVMGLVVRAVLSTHENSSSVTVVTNNATSHLVGDVAREFGAKIEEVDVGEINVVKRMQELDSPVGGEGSSAGGIIPPMAGRDGLMTLAVILRYLAETEKTFDEALLDLPRYTTLQEKVKVDPNKAQGVRDKIIVAMKKQCKHVEVFGDDGGVKCLPEEKEFVTFRMSKTEAGVYRIIVDTKEEERTKELMEQSKGLLQRLAGSK